MAMSQQALPYGTRRGRGKYVETLYFRLNSASIPVITPELVSLGYCRYLARSTESGSSGYKPPALTCGLPTP